MSIRIMNLVWNFYPGKGNELLTALALANYANDSGENIYPSVKTVAGKTRQSKRSVQYCLRGMQKSKWLELVSHARGGRPSTTDLSGKTRGRARTYRISPRWIAMAQRGELGADGASKSTTAAPIRAQGAEGMDATAPAPESSVKLLKDKPPAAWQELGRQLGIRRYRK